MTPKAFIYEDSQGYCRIVVAQNSFKMEQESEANAIARFAGEAIPAVTEFLCVNQDLIPKDKTFRDAWKRGDVHEPIKIDFCKALEIHRKRLEEACKKKIAQLDLDLDLAIKSQNLPLQVAITSTKKILRVLHTMNLTHCKTIEDIKKSVPKELLDVWQNHEAG